MKGQPRGTCASGFGTCCVFISDGLNDLKVLERKVTYLQNPNYPRVNTTSFRETVEIIPIDETIKQIRLDLIDFEVSTEGFLNLIINGKRKMDYGSEEEPCNVHKVRVVLPEENVNIGDLCGNNNGQHLYIHLDTSTRRYGQAGSVRIELEFLGRRKRYQYNIKVEQLDYTDKNDIERMVGRERSDLCNHGYF